MGTWVVGPAFFLGGRCWRRRRDGGSDNTGFGVGVGVGRFCGGVDGGWRSGWVVVSADVSAGVAFRFFSVWHAGVGLRGGFACGGVDCGGRSLGGVRIAGVDRGEDAGGIGADQASGGADGSDAWLVAGGALGGDKRGRVGGGVESGGGGYGDLAGERGDRSGGGVDDAFGDGSGAAVAAEPGQQDGNRGWGFAGPHWGAHPAQALSGGLGRSS